jgi:hypothetical protein
MLTNHNKSATTTKNKLDVIAESIAHINEYFGGKTPKGIALLLPGGHFQVKRHIAEFELKGIPEHNQVHVEYEESVHASHLRLKKRDGHTFEAVGACIHETFYSAVQARLPISILEKDGTTTYSSQDESSIRLAAKVGVPVLEFTFLVKSNITDHLSTWKKRLGFRRYKNPTAQSGLSNPIGKITEGACSQLASELGYDLKVIPYRGKGGCHMMTCIFTKQK